MFTYKSERKCLKQQTKKKEHVQLAQAQVLLLTLGTVRHAPGREQYMRLAKKEKKKFSFSLQVDD